MADGCEVETLGVATDVRGAAMASGAKAAGRAWSGGRDEAGDGPGVGVGG